jgi:hypothetical protein
MNNYTLKFKEETNAQTRAKFKKMQSGTGRFGQTSFECWFSTWHIGLDDEPEGLQDRKTLYIYVYTTYHSKESLLRMYNSNCTEF